MPRLRPKVLRLEDRLAPAVVGASHALSSVDAESPLVNAGLTATTPKSANGAGQPTSPIQLTEFELRGTIIGTPGTGGGAGNTIAAVFNNDLTDTWIAPIANGGWAGVDMGDGQSYVLTRWQFAPRSEMYQEYEYLIVGAQLQASNDPTFSTGVVTLDTISSNYPYIPRWQLSERLVSETTPYRCYRVVAADGSSGSIAEVKFIGQAVQGIPLPPTMSPWGGRFLNGQATVALHSDSATAQIYYTTDGSTPTPSSTLYTGPFHLDCSGMPDGITVNAVAYDPSSQQPSTTISGIFKNEGFVPGADWSDDRGILIEAHDGSILDNTSRDGYYYWYGCFLNKWDFGGGLEQPKYEGVWAYRSTDLLNWQFVGQILPNIPGVIYIERPHVLYNALNDNYVLWAHARYPNQLAAIATSSSPNGPWTWVNPGLNPDGFGYKDSNLFLDPDTGIAYAAYTDGNQDKTYVTQLSPDFQSAGIAHVLTSTTMTNREAPVLFKRRGVYFLITSVGNYYSTDYTYDERYQTASNPLGTWSAATPLFASDPLGTLYNAQSSFVLNIAGTDQFLYGADRWRMTGLEVNPELYSSRQVWIPLTFPTDTTVQAVPTSDWHLALAPRVTGVAVNDGTAQRSIVTSLTVTFDRVVTLPAEPADAFQVTGPGGAVTFHVVASTIGGVTVATITFPELPGGSLTDGRYTLDVLTNLVSAGGVPLDGDDDGLPGGNYTFGDDQGFFRLFGDINGDRTVNGLDLVYFRDAFGSQIGDAYFLGYLDFDADGVINGFDFGQFRIRFGVSLP